MDTHVRRLREKGKKQAKELPRDAVTQARHNQTQVHSVARQRGRKTKRKSKSSGNLGLRNSRQEKWNRT